MVVSDQEASVLYWNVTPENDFESDLVQNVVFQFEIIECEKLKFIDRTRDGVAEQQFHSLVSSYILGAAHNLNATPTLELFVDFSSYPDELQDSPYEFDGVSLESFKGSTDPRYILDLLCHPELNYFRLRKWDFEDGKNTYCKVEAAEGLTGLIETLTSSGPWHAVPITPKKLVSVPPAPKVTSTDTKKPNPLDHSRLLDVHTWSDHPEVNSFVDSIYDEHFGAGNSNIRKRHIKVILLDLYVAWIDDPELKISFSRNMNSYKSKTRYNELHISKMTITVVNTLIDVGLIGQTKGFQDSRSGKKNARISRIWPTPNLIEKFKGAKFGVLDISIPEGRESIILRNDNGKDIEYEDNDETNKMREVLKDYNQLLQNTFIDIPTLENNWLDPDPENPVSAHRLYVSQNGKFVRRIFNRGSFDKGGRFYGGWWQRCSKEWRSQIFMDDCPVSEIDYSGLHIVILYAQLGINYWEEIKDDPYTIPLPDFLDDERECRGVCKLLMLMALNANNDIATIRALRAQADTGSYIKTLSDDQLKTILDALREKHPLIASKFTSDAGVDLMKTDSDITELVIKHFTDKGIPILTVYDSYLVPYGYERELGEAMIDAFHAITGQGGAKLKEETDRTASYEPLEIDDGVDVSAWEVGMKERFNPYRSERYRHHLEQFNEYFAKPEVPDWSLDHEMEYDEAEFR